MKFLHVGALALVCSSMGNARGEMNNSKASDVEVDAHMKVVDIEQPEVKPRWVGKEKKPAFDSGAAPVRKVYNPPSFPEHGQNPKATKWDHLVAEEESPLPSAHDDVDKWAELVFSSTKDDGKPSTQVFGAHEEFVESMGTLEDEDNDYTEDMNLSEELQQIMREIDSAHKELNSQPTNYGESTSYDDYGNYDQMTQNLGPDSFIAMMQHSDTMHHSAPTAPMWHDMSMMGAGPPNNMYQFQPPMANMYQFHDMPPMMQQPMNGMEMMMPPMGMMQEPMNGMEMMMPPMGMMQQPMNGMEMMMPPMGMMMPQMGMMMPQMGMNMQPMMQQSRGAPSEDEAVAGLLQMLMGGMGFDTGFEDQPLVIEITVSAALPSMGGMLDMMPWAEDEWTTGPETSWGMEDEWTMVPETAWAMDSTTDQPMQQSEETQFLAFLDNMLESFDGMDSPEYAQDDESWYGMDMGGMDMGGMDMGDMGGMGMADMGMIFNEPEYVQYGEPLYDMGMGGMGMGDMVKIFNEPQYVQYPEDPVDMISYMPAMDVVQMPRDKGPMFNEQDMRDLEMLMQLMGGHETQQAPAAPANKMVGGSGAPAWTQSESDVEAPAGERDMGSYIMKVYTEEQQQRMGVDETGHASAPAAPVDWMKQMDKIAREIEVGVQQYERMTQEDQGIVNEVYRQLADTMQQGNWAQELADKEQDFHDMESFLADEMQDLEEWMDMMAPSRYTPGSHP